MGAEPKTTDENDDESRLDLDRRLSVFWLQEALERSLYARFCEEDASERAIIVHAKRHGAHPNFALLDAQGKLILITVKRDALTPSTAKQAERDIVKYARLERTLGKLATWYCQHAIDVNSWFEYRGDYCIVSKADVLPNSQGDKKTEEGTQFGRLIRMNVKHYPDYLAGAEEEKEARAIEMFRTDYARIVKKDLSGRAGDRVEVGRCIVIARSWPENTAEKEQIEEWVIERWSYAPPKLWTCSKPRWLAEQLSPGSHGMK